MFFVTMLEFVKKLCLVVVLSAGLCNGLSAQTVGLKTNLLYDATATANLGVELGLAPRWTVDLSGNLIVWDIAGDMRWRHWLVQPELRYWFCDRFSRHFVGLHALGGQYNLGNIPNNISFLGQNFYRLTDHRYEGWAVGAGIAYGYAWALGKHWNLELEAGFGYARFFYDIYECSACRKIVAEDVTHNYVGPTKAAINLVYVF